MPTQPSHRIASIDLLRGLVMIIMALDHTRDFFHSTAMTADPLDPATTTLPLYATRWITHFCAPTFVFLSGLSAWLSAQSKTPGEASGFLIKRGLWLIVVEVVIISLGLTFNPFYNFIILQVIWAIGCSMVLLGLLSRVSYTLVAVVGVLLVLGHNLTDVIPLSASPAWNVSLTFPTVIPVTPTHLVGAFYSVLPWTGILLLGYAAGPLYRRSFDAARRQRILLLWGAGFILLFLVLRLLNAYGNPQPWKSYGSALRTGLSFFNVSKYPPSLMYTGIMLGPGLIILALTEKARGAVARVLTVYGKVPFFYYVLHFYILHTLLVMAFFGSGYTTDQIASPGSLFWFRPVAFGYSLPVVYTIWLATVASLYLPCRWFGKYKATNQAWWLRYV